MKFKRITKEEEIEIGKIYLVTLQESSPLNTKLQNISLRYFVTGPPQDYPTNDLEHILFGTRWISTKYLWGDNTMMEEDITSLRDLGVGDKLHNNHKLYQISEEEWQLVKEMSLEEFEKLTV